MKNYNKKMKIARARVEKAIALLQGAHKAAYAAGKAYEKEFPNTDHAYYVWANDVTDGISKLMGRAARPVNELENEVM